MASRCAVLLSLAVGAAGHGMMTLPTPRSGGSLHQAAKGGEFDFRTFNNASWFTQDARIPAGQEVTSCAEYVTGVPCTPDSRQPWRAPGTAPVFSPCGGFCVNEGVGSPSGCELGREPDNWWSVQDGRDLPKAERAEWVAGGTAKVAFTALYNHGGGYAYRLCPAGEAQTEGCFQRHHLNYATDTTVVHWTHGEEAEYSAVTMSRGTHPEGSQWRTIRIPSCSTTWPSICGHELLPRPCERCCAHHCDTWDYSLVDTLSVPDSLPAGDYTLGWRWDGEINHQVWQNCADVTIVAASANTTTPRRTNGTAD